MNTWPADARAFSRPTHLQGKSPGNEVGRCCSFLAFATRLGSWGFASANTSLYTWLHISPDYLVTYTLWFSSYLRWHGGRKDDFLSRALEGQYILGQNSIFLCHISPVLSASLAKVKHQIESRSLNKAFRSVISLPLCLKPLHIFASSIVPNLTVRAST